MCCRDGCELGWHCCEMALLGGIGWSFRSTYLYNPTSRIRNYQMHLSGLWQCNRIHLLCQPIDWMAERQLHNVVTIDAAYDLYSHSLQERIGNYDKPGFLMPLILDWMDKSLICRWEKCLPRYYTTINLHCRHSIINIRLIVYALIMIAWPYRMGQIREFKWIWRKRVMC